MGEVNFNKILHEGDRVVLHDGQDGYVTRVDEITSEETFTVLQPWTLGRAFTTHIGAAYKVVCTTVTGVHYFMAETIGMDMSARVRTMHLKYVGKYYRVQNRKAYRCQVMLPMYIRRRPRESQTGVIHEEAWLQTKTLDISLAGLKVRLPHKYSAGDIVSMRICIDKFGITATLPDMLGVIVRAM